MTDAISSFTHLQSHLYVASDLEFVKQNERKTLSSMTIDLLLIMNGLRKSAKGRYT